jgi:hypothetical protein
MTVALKVSKIRNPRVSNPQSAILNPQSLIPNQIASDMTLGGKKTSGTKNNFDHEGL